jgi:hypothetical protein
MVRSDPGDGDPWVPFLAELRQAQTGEPIEVWLLGIEGERHPTLAKVAPAQAPVGQQAELVSASSRPMAPTESHPIPVRRLNGSSPESGGPPADARFVCVRFLPDGNGRPVDA